MRKAIFPGTFDPFTIGHYSVVERALTFMDEIVIGIGMKRPLQTLTANWQGLKPSCSSQNRN